MEPVRLWAAVEFTAQSGSTDALLGHAAQAGLHLTRIVPLPGGFRARCAAWHYRPLAALARQGHVRLRVKKRLGLFFRLRPLLRRTGLWAGLALFIPLLLWSQQFVWAVDTSTLTRGQAARAFAVLRQADLAPGAAATEAKRTAGEYALLESGEFSWASLNFAKGRLEVRAGRCSAQARHCGRDPARPARPVRRCGHQDQPDQRHDAGGARADRGGWTGADRHGAAGAGRCTDLCPGSGHRAGTTGVE